MAKTTKQLTSPFATHSAKDLSQRTSAVDCDVDLLTRIAAGDGKAMHVLYERHRGPILRFVMRFVRGRSAAEDVVNEVFYDVWRSASAFQGRSQVATWLMAIARNKALAITHRRTAEPLSEEIVERIEDPDDNPEMMMEKNQRGSIIRNCLAKLSPAHREIIDLVYYRERKIDDVAKAIGVPRNTVKTRMFYARKELGQLLGAQGVTTTLGQ
jgi:RNA polymerase sigma-70 factor (ECF subfamily)